MSEERLKVIETKIDKLAEAITKLAVIDERLANVISSNNRTAARVEKTEEELKKIPLLEDRVDRISVFSKVLASAVIVAMVNMIFKVI